MAEELSVTIQSQDDITTATVNLTELTSMDTDAVLARLRDMIDAGKAPRIVLDLTRVKFMDSVALGALVVILRRVKQNDGRLALAGLGGHALKVMQVTGLEKVFEMHAGVASAVESLKRPL